MKKAYWIVIVVFGIVLLLVSLASISLMGYGNNMGWGMMSGWPSGMMHGWGFVSQGWIGLILMWLVPVTFLLLIILGIVALVRGMSSEGESIADPYQHSEAQPSPRDILQIRYARGEITREQYLEILADLG